MPSACSGLMSPLSSLQYHIRFALRFDVRCLFITCSFALDYRDTVNLLLQAGVAGRSDAAAGPSATTGGAESETSFTVLPPAAALAEWLRGRVTWFIRTLATTLPSIDDGSHVAFLLQVWSVVVLRLLLRCMVSHFLLPLTPLDTL
jgi:hypothetical protein